MAPTIDRPGTSTDKKPSFEGAVNVGEEISSRRFCVRPSAIILDCLLNARHGFLQVVKVHSGMQLDVGIERQKPRFRYGGVFETHPSGRKR